MENSKVENTENIEDESQLELEIGAPPSERWYKFKNRLKKQEAILENLPYWKNFVNVFALATIIISAGGAFLGLFTFYDKLPSRVPFLYSHDLENWNSIEKSEIVFYVAGIYFLCLVAYLVSFRIYKYDRKLVLLSNSIITLTSIFVLLGLTQLLILVIR